jgi:hypothetical protein
MDTALLEEEGSDTVLESLVKKVCDKRPSVDPTSLIVTPGPAIEVKKLVVS